VVDLDPRAEDGGEGLVLRAVRHEERPVRADLLEDPVELLGQDEVRGGSHTDVPADRRDLRVDPLLHEVVVRGDRAQERVDVGVFGVCEAELERRGEVVVPAD